MSALLADKMFRKYITFPEQFELYPSLKVADNAKKSSTAMFPLFCFSCTP